MLYVVIAALVAVAACVAYPLFHRNHGLEEVDRFHVARSLTTTWASEPQEAVTVPEPGEDLTD